MEECRTIVEQEILISVLKNQLEVKEAQLKFIGAILNDMKDPLIYALDDKIKAEKQHRDLDKPSKFEIVGDEEFAMSSYLVTEFMIKTFDFTKRELEALLNAIDTEDYRLLKEIVDERELLRQELSQFSTKGSTVKDGE